MRLLIVGAGPAGAALGFLLARGGLDVVLLDRESDFDRLFRGEALMPSSMDAIAQMGLRDDFTAVPHRIIECMEFYVDGRRVLRADWPEVAGRNAVHVVSQPMFLEMITSAARRYPTFELRMSTTVRDVQVSDKGVTLEVERPGRTETIEGDFVVGADGRASTVRARAGLKLERLPFPFDVTWFSLPLPWDQHADPRFRGFSRGDAVVAIYPSWNDRLRLGCHLPRQLQQPPQNGASAVSGILDKVTRIVDESTSDFIRRHAEETGEPMAFKVLFGRCARWSAPRILLIGDAAHPMSPVRAQGINLALRDAIVAANHLVPACQKGDFGALQEAAEKIQSEREFEIVESQRLQLMVAQPPALARSPLLRITLLPLLRRLGIVKRLFLKSEIPLRHGIVPVQLTVESRVGEA